MKNHSHLANVRASERVPEQPFDRLHYDESESDPSALHHFHSKLLRLKETMHTQTAKALAMERHRFMEAFVEEFMIQWEGQR